MKKISLFVLIISLVAMITACGSGDEPAATSPAEPVATEVEATTEAEVEATTEAEVEATTETEAEATTEAEVEATTEAEVEATTEAEVEATTEAEAEASEEVQVIEVTMNTSGYEPAEIKVKAGTQVSFELKNTDSEEHDLYNRKAKIDIGLQPKQEKTYDWVAPEKAGTYVAECSFHEGLILTVIVE